MSTARDGVIVWGDLRGGRNGDVSPLSLTETECAEAFNVDWFDGTVARKRGGHDEVSLTGAGVASGGSNVGVTRLARHVPANDESVSELWALGHAGGASVVLARFVAGVWSTPTATEGPSSLLVFGTASFDGKFFLAYRSAVDRLHVWDGTSVRRVGLAAPGAAPTVANTGAGTYAATVRYYRQRYIELSGSDVIRRGEASAVVTFTPSGTGTAARVTKAATVTEGETHWELEASADNLVFYRIARTVVGTTTVDDSAAPSTYATTGTLTDAAGAHSLFPSVDYLIVNQGRLLGAFASSEGRYSRIYFTPVLGSADIGDAERIPNQSDQKNYLDLDESDGGAITGFGGPIQGVVFVFKQRAIWSLTPTGDLTTPFDLTPISKTIGAIASTSIVNAEDEDGVPAIYFTSYRGPYRMGRRGLEDLSLGIRDRMTATSLPDFACWCPDKHQVWFFSDVVSGTFERLVFDTRFRAWSVQRVVPPTGKVGLVLNACVLFSTLTDGSATTLTPYLGGYTLTGNVPILLKGDTADLTDEGGVFQAYVTTRAVAPAGLVRSAAVQRPTLVAHAAAGVSLQITMIPDFGVSSRSASVSLQASGPETSVIRTVQGVEQSGVGVVQYTVGDAAAQAAAWTVDLLAVPYTGQEAR